MKSYYDMPEQVMFIDECEAETYGTDCKAEVGIAYQDYVICGCCGTIISLSNIVWLEEMKWIDIHEAIIGDDDECGAAERYKPVIEKWSNEEED